MGCNIYMNSFTLPLPLCLFAGNLTNARFIIPADNIDSVRSERSPSISNCIISGAELSPFFAKREKIVPND